MMMKEKRKFPILTLPQALEIFSSGGSLMIAPVSLELNLPNLTHQRILKEETFGHNFE